MTEQFIIARIRQRVKTRSLDTGHEGWAILPKLFVPHNFVVPRIFFIKTYNKTKILPY